MREPYVFRLQGSVGLNGRCGVLTRFVEHASMRVLETESIFVVKNQHAPIGWKCAVEKATLQRVQPNYL